VITIAGISDHLRPEWLITITGIRTVSTPSPVIDLMAALKRSLAHEPSAPEQRQKGSKPKRHSIDVSRYCCCP
jgi:hypothetical protein